MGYPRGGTEIAPGGALGVCWPAFLCCCFKRWPALDVGQSHQSGQLACCLLAEVLTVCFCKETCLCTLSSVLGQLLFCCFFACPMSPLLTCSVVCMIAVVYLDLSCVYTPKWIQACTTMPVTAMSWVLKEEIYICHDINNVLQDHAKALHEQHSGFRCAKHAISEPPPSSWTGLGSDQPAQVEGLSNVHSISLGGVHALALVDNE